ncbi:N-acetylmuramoyl-L-alanine amidase, partial [Streptomyces pathocidini]|uniref:N-acetylmuramoyl-L-alanine amidase n=1 Tax=Streptomyces pathocidini TaxID=1650571 RepID=UPI0033F7E456
CGMHVSGPTWPSVGDRSGAYQPKAAATSARLRTLDRAAGLTGIGPAALRQDPAANIRGGAALLAAAQKKLGRPLSSDPAQWYGAVARYSGADDRTTAATYANDVYEVIRSGATRTTDNGQRIVLPASPRVSPDTAQVRRLGLRAAAKGRAECPSSVACEWVPAPYKEFGDADPPDYGNHDLADRGSQDIEYIIIHDTEGAWNGVLKMVQDPAYVSWQYTLRSSDGHIAQHVRNRDVAWHAGNWYTNAKSIGLEHEGFLASPDAWYTEAMYRSSARLVRYLSEKYDIPLNRQHILGHDNVPGPTAKTISGMHTDPGPYWDWAHYFELLGREFRPTAGPDSDVVTILPEYSRNQPPFVDCEKKGKVCAPHGSAAVRLHTEPREDAPLVQDPGTHPGGGASTKGVNDIGARATTGQQFAVAARKGDWTAIWFLGRKAWFLDSDRQRASVNSRGFVATPKEGLDEVPVYGRAYPEEEAYPDYIDPQPLEPLPYRFRAGQAYVVGLKVAGEYYWATTFDPEDHEMVQGEEEFYQIQLGHRIAYVKADDVDVERPRG